MIGEYDLFLGSVVEPELKMNKEVLDKVSAFVEKAAKTLLSNPAGFQTIGFSPGGETSAKLLRAHEEGDPVANVSIVAGDKEETGPYHYVLLSVSASKAERPFFSLNIYLNSKGEVEHYHVAIYCY